MAEAQKLGKLGKILTTLGLAWAEANEDLELMSSWMAHKAKEGGRGDLIPRIYAIPSGKLKLTAQATIKEGKVELFGLNGSSEKEELFHVELECPFQTIPPDPEQIKLMMSTTKKDLLKRMKARGLIEAEGTDETLFVVETEE